MTITPAVGAWSVVWLFVALAAIAHAPDVEAYRALLGEVGR